MDRISGYFFNGKSSQPKAAHLVVEESELRIDLENNSSITFTRDQILSCPNPSTSVLTIDFKCGAKFEAYSQNINLRILDFDRGFPKVWENHWHYCVVGLLMIVAFSGLFYWKFFPSLSRKIAMAMPESIEYQVLENFKQTINSLNDHENLNSELYSKLAFFSEPIRNDYPELKLKVRMCCKKGLLANAFALPGGEIFATQDLVSELSPDELTAVLLHEVGHIYYHHPMQHLIEHNFISATVMLAAGYGEAYGWGGLILNLKNSRESEREADLFAAIALKKIGKSPSLLGEALSHLEKLNKVPLNYVSWLSTHPMTEERKKYLNAL